MRKYAEATLVSASLWPIRQTAMTNRQLHQHSDEHTLIILTHVVEDRGRSRVPSTIQYYRNFR